MLHGILEAAESFIVNDEEIAPAFMLANAGYDVWLGNSRGNFHSKSHASLLPEDALFWDFSLQHLAQFDLPAAFTYITNLTDQEKMAYIGHS